MSYDPNEPYPDDPQAQSEPAPAPQPMQMAPQPTQAAAQAPGTKEYLPPEVQQAVANPQMFDAFKDPRFLTDVAQTYLDNGDEVGLRWLSHAHQAVQENSVTAAQRMIAGDGAGAVAAWNQSGRYNDAKSATRNADGKTWTVQRSNGQSIVIDPVREMESLMSPDAFARNEREKTQAAATAAYQRAHARYMDKSADFQAERNQTILDRQAMVNAERAKEAGWRADLQEARQAGAKAVGEFDLKHGPTAIYSQALSAFKDTDDPVGKATAAVLAAPGAITPEISDDGKTVLLRNGVTGQEWKRIPAEQYTKITGYAPPAPAKKPTTPAAGPPKPSAPPPAPSAPGRTLQPRPGSGELQSGIPAGVAEKYQGAPGVKNAIAFIDSQIAEEGRKGDKADVAKLQQLQRQKSVLFAQLPPE